MVYEEPKHLVAHGYATVHESPVGRRHRVRYSITKAGRRALAEWVNSPPAPLTLQFEGLLKVLFADQGAPAANRKVLAAIGEWAAEARATSAVRAHGYLNGDYIEGVDFDERATIVAQTVGFLAEFYDLVERWSDWASELAPATTATTALGLAARNRASSSVVNAAAPALVHVRPPRPGTAAGLRGTRLAPESVVGRERNAA